MNFEVTKREKIPLNDAIKWLTAALSNKLKPLFPFAMLWVAQMIIAE